MKKAMKLIGMYFVILFFGIGIGAIFKSLNIGLLNYSVGEKISFFSVNVFVYSLFYAASCMFFLICPVLAFLRIRQKTGISQLIAYIFLALLTWGICLPATFYFGDKFSKVYSQKNDFQNKNLTGNYFRENSKDQKIYYFLDNLENQEEQSDGVATVVIDKNASILLESKNAEEVEELFNLATPYKDIIVKKSFEQRGIPFLINLDEIIAEGKKSFYQGWNFYLGFLSIALLLCSLYGISNLFEWRLLNVCNVIFSTAAVLLYNSLYYQTFFESIRGKINSVRMFAFLSRYVNEPALVLVNILISIVYITLGSVCFFSGKKNKTYQRRQQ